MVIDHACSKIVFFSTLVAYIKFTSVYPSQFVVLDAKEEKEEIL